VQRPFHTAIKTLRAALTQGQPHGRAHRAGWLFAAALMTLPWVGYAFDITEAMIDNIRNRYGALAGERVGGWRELMVTPTDTPDTEKLKRVNDFFNRAAFRSDKEHWGEDDYWATPLELLVTDAGDCEDYAIAKFFTLREMGMGPEHLKVTYVKSLNLNQAHMVLAWYSTPTAEPLILDNLVQDILPASQRTDLVPVYSFNADGLWLARARGLGERVGDSGRISQWASINERMQQEFTRTGPATLTGQANLSTSEESKGSDPATTSTPERR
jgi:predicted transglutaminase-like cysteine proteinase